MLLSIFFIIVGLVILIIGAEGLVRGASSLAAKLKIPPLVIGLTVVAFGTSAPELTVNILAAINGSPDLAIGNVVGSNIANVLLILGVSAMIVPLTVKSNTVWKEIPLALLGVILLFIMGNDHMFDGVPLNALTRTDGLALIALLIIFMYYIFGLAKGGKSKAEAAIEQEGDKVHQYPFLVSFILVVVGLGGLVFGGRLLINGAIYVAQAAGLSEALIGLTIVAIGTSLPELATSVVAALKRQTDIAIGNVVGSNIFNVFFVLGTTSVILPLPFSPAINVDVLMSVVATLLLFIVMFLGKKHRLTRWEGALFLGLYISYIAYLIQRG